MIQWYLGFLLLRKYISPKKILLHFQALTCIDKLPCLDAAPRLVMSMCHLGME